MSPGSLPSPIFWPIKNIAPTIMKKKPIKIKTFPILGMGFVLLEVAPLTTHALIYE